MKLDIQLFSGGSYDYKFYVLEDYYVGKMYDIELNDLMKDLVDVLHDLEWWQSSDYSEEAYRKTIKNFKEKWFQQSKNNRLKKYIDENIDKTKQELYQLIGQVSHE